jgi:hypothetical protein
MKKWVYVSFTLLMFSANAKPSPENVEIKNALIESIVNSQSMAETCDQLTLAMPQNECGHQYLKLKIQLALASTPQECAQECAISNACVKYVDCSGNKIGCTCVCTGPGTCSR